MAAPSDERPDERLMLALRDGDLGAFDTLFRRHYDSVRDLCARIVATGESADDLAQETFLRILRHRATFRGDARFTTWSYRIARNVCLQHIARASRERRLTDAWRTETAVSVGCSSDESSERSAVLEAAMQALDPEQRAVLVLCRYRGLSFDEIGQILGCSTGAARVRAHRALVALRGKYREIAQRVDGGW